MEKSAIDLGDPNGEFIKATMKLVALEGKQRAGTATEEDEAAYPSVLSVYLARQAIREAARISQRMDRAAILAQEHDDRIEKLESGFIGLERRITQLSRELQNFLNLKGGSSK